MAVEITEKRTLFQVIARSSRSPETMSCSGSPRVYASLLSVTAMAGPTPWPTSRYQEPEGEMRASSQIFNSSVWVPLLFPREIESDSDYAIAAKAVAKSASPLRPS